MSKTVEFNDNQWFRADEDIVTIGVTEEALGFIENLIRVSLPQEGEKLEIERVCGELDTKEGTTNLYSPFNGLVVEINEALLESPSLIYEDPQGDSWLFRIESDKEDIIEYIQAI